MSADADSPKAPHDDDPYRTYKFRVKWDGRYVAGVSRVSGLTRTTDVITHRRGGDPSTPRRAPGQSSYEAITLERGVTQDAAFERWANKVWDYHNTTSDDQTDGARNQDVSLKEFRKDIVIELYNEAGQKLGAYKVHRCWPSEFLALPELDAEASRTAIQSLTLENEGWERTSAEGPTEPPLGS